jgi:hypothetical protein
MAPIDRLLILAIIVAILVAIGAGCALVHVTQEQPWREAAAQPVMVVRDTIHDTVFVPRHRPRAGRQP